MTATVDGVNAMLPTIYAIGPSRLVPTNDYVPTTESRPPRRARLPDLVRIDVYHLR